MKTFFNILQSIINIKNKRYPDDPFTILHELNEYIYIKEKSHIIGLINTIYYKEKTCKKGSPFSKNAFSKLFSLNSILENTFYEKQLKETIFDIFTKAQKHYFAFTRLAHIYKIKKHHYVVTDDLMMNNLDKHHKLEPLQTLNPYNNQPLSNATLYNIYFQMKKIERVIPLLFHLFFLTNFDKDKFIEQYEPNIREFSIKKYIFNSPYTVLYSSVISMLNHNVYTNKLTIDKLFPKDLLVDIFRPFLFHHYISHYYIKATSTFYNSKDLLYNKLRQFYKFNPAFGRKTVKLIKKNDKIINKEYILNTKHISFYNIPFSNKKIKIIETPLQAENRVIAFLNNILLDHLYDDDESEILENSDDESEMLENIDEEQNTSTTETSSDTEIQDENDSIS